MNMIEPTLESIYGKDYLKMIKIDKTFWVALDRSQVPISEDHWNAYRIKYPKRSKSLVTWFIIRITYIRSGVFFYQIEGFPNIEGYFLEGSLFARAIIPTKIDIKELEKLWDMPKDYEFNNYNGAIEIELV